MGSFLEARQLLKLADSRYCSICVGTPSGNSGELDLQQITSVTAEAEYLKNIDAQKYLSIVYRSTTSNIVENLLVPKIEKNWSKTRSCWGTKPRVSGESSAVEDFFAPSVSYLQQIKSQNED